MGLPVQSVGMDVGWILESAFYRFTSGVGPEAEVLDKCRSVEVASRVRIHGARSLEASLVRCRPPTFILFHIVEVPKRDRRFPPAALVKKFPCSHQECLHVLLPYLAMKSHWREIGFIRFV